MSRKFLQMSMAAYLLVGLIGGSAAWGGSVWEELKPQVFGQRAILNAGDAIALNAPYRPDNVMQVPLTADVRLPEGERIKAVSFIVDENPSPVAAGFRLGEGRNRAVLTTHIRLNQQSDVRVVVETGDGRLLMAEQLVKFAGGQASCSAPPQGDPSEIAANMGKMPLALLGPKATATREIQKAHYELNHPNHTGMVMDQITLHYIPLLMVERVEIFQGDDLVLTMDGSITLSQNPTIGFDFPTNGATELRVCARDTSGATWEKKFPLGPGS